jgi:flagellar hook capping protein FlgD
VANLNGDGVLDVTYMQYDISGCAVMVNLGRGGDELPAQEGAYPVEGEGSQVLAGDVDGYVDLVALVSNWPNPFNAGTTIPVQVDQESAVTVTIHNLVGQPVRTLDLGMISAGTHTPHWDGRDASGHPMPSGVYLCRGRAAGSVAAVGRMLRLE